MEDGFYRNDGTHVDPDSIPMPALCLSCSSHEDKEIACTLTRMDQLDEIRNGEMFCCYHSRKCAPPGSIR